MKMNSFTKMRRIADDNNLSPIEKLKASWYFNKWYEKIFLVLSSLSLIYTIIRIILQGFW